MTVDNQSDWEDIADANGVDYDCPDHTVIEVDSVLMDMLFGPLNGLI